VVDHGLETETLARLYLEQGHVMQAFQVYEKLLAKDPGRASVQEGLARCRALLASRGKESSLKNPKRLAVLQELLSRLTEKTPAAPRAVPVAPVMRPAPAPAAMRPAAAPMAVPAGVHPPMPAASSRLAEFAAKAVIAAEKPPAAVAPQKPAGSPKQRRLAVLQGLLQKLERIQMDQRPGI
jgi:hypothetical protein